MDRAERLLDLVALLLDAREPVSFAELRDLFPNEYGGSRGAAERKLERDKADLLDLGVPIEYVAPEQLDERDLGGYRIDRKTFFLPDPRLLPEESAALYAAGAAALATRDFPFAQDLQHALRKISLAGDTHAVGNEAARRLLVVRPGDPLRAEKLRTLGDAVARRKRVHIHYEAPPGLDGKPGNRTERDVEPWGLAFRGRAWRLVGRDPDKGQRVFLVERIARVEVNPQKPHTPDFEPPQDFDAGDAAARSSKPWLWEHHAPDQVRLRFAKGSEAIGERLFDAPDGQLTVTNLEGLVPQILSLGDRVVVESPAAAQEKIRAALLRIEEKLRSAPEPSDEWFAPAPSDAPAAPGRTAEPELKRERLRRLLLIVPAARRRPGVKLADLARDLGLDPQDLREDIDLLGLVGTTFSRSLADLTYPRPRT